MASDAGWWAQGKRSKQEHSLSHLVFPALGHKGLRDPLGRWLLCQPGFPPLCASWTSIIGFAGCTHPVLGCARFMLLLNLWLLALLKASGKAFISSCFPSLIVPSLSQGFQLSHPHCQATVKRSRHIFRGTMPVLTPGQQVRNPAGAMVGGQDGHG